MDKRIWDPKGRYSEGYVKEYLHWILEVSFRQHTLGCFIIFAKRKIERISDLNDEEIVDLKRVMGDFEGKMSTLKEFNPDRFNYLQLGNGLHHLHFHAIPRYRSSRKLFGKEWKDETFGQPPIWTKSEVGSDMIRQIKELFISG